MFKLTVIEGPLSGSTFLLSAEKNTIGRTGDNTVTILDQSVSRRHLQVVSSENGFFIVDLNSKNGSILDGTLLAPNKLYPVNHGCEVKIGNTRLRIGIVEGDSTSAVPGDDEEETLTDMKAVHAGVRWIARPGTPTVAQPQAAAQGFHPKTITFRVGANRNLATIYRILSTVGTSLDLDFLLNTTLDLVMDTIRPERGLLFFTTEMEKDNWVPRAARSKDRTKPAAGPAASKRVIRKVFAQGDSILTSEAPEGTGTSEPKDTRSIVCAPIKSKEQFMGIIYLDSPMGSDPFTQDDLELLSAVGIQLGTLTENRELVSDNQELFLGVVKALINIIEVKDKYTYGHSERVTAISIALAQELDWSAKDVETVRVSALLHDIGKVGVPEDILNKPGRLTDEEFGKIKKHPVMGKDFVKHMKKFNTLLDGILYHHERYDGRGYPEGVAGEAIPFIARIIAVADSYDAMTSDRAYRRSLGEQAALDELRKNRGTQFDSTVVDAFEIALQKGKIPK